MTTRVAVSTGPNTVVEVGKVVEVQWSPVNDPKTQKPPFIMFTVFPTKPREAYALFLNEEEQKKLKEEWQISELDNSTCRDGLVWVELHKSEKKFAYLGPVPKGAELGIEPPVAP